MAFSTIEVEQQHSSIYRVVYIYTDIIVIKNGVINLTLLKTLSDVKGIQKALSLPRL
jgi:hypothetical protein